jgi:hypothetical protein
LARQWSASTASQLRLDVVEVEAGVDDGPAVLFLEQPEVDVVQLEGQRHAQPAHAGRDLQRLAGCRLLGDRISQRFGRFQLIKHRKSD